MTSYQDVWKIKIAKQTDGAGWHVSSAHAFFLAMDVVDISIPYTVYPAQSSWISIGQNFVTGDIPRFKVLRYSEASLFEL